MFLMLRNHRRKIYFLVTAIVFSLFTVTPVFASQDLGTFSLEVTSAVGSLEQFVIAAFYMFGCAFIISALVKYKVYRQNPGQYTLSVPLTLFFIAITLIGMAILMKTLGHSFFG